ncbi:hypothetical protein P7F88_25345 [Vibrio hannami]|uniref:hypothetical protein n=1 Tax=Vibrio hannami TaxID=2717094 RepID=UPI00240F8756|nr:hypothetical protein [Vibrio hannami]MDG3089191.1 hypothetical protein [Vibrio hannami]
MLTDAACSGGKWTIWTAPMPSQRWIGRLLSAAKTFRRRHLEGFFVSKHYRMIPNDRFFYEVWTSKVIVREIAAIYCTSRPAIYRAADRFGFPKRNPVEPVIEAEIPRPLDLMDELRWSKGRYTILLEIAEREGFSMTKAQQLYRRARRDE